MRDWKTIKKYEDILFEQLGGIAKITINRPKVYNAFRPQTNMEMLDAMAYCRECPEIGVIILTGAGDKAFCSGGDQNVKGTGGYIDANGVPRLNVLDLHKARDRHGQRLCDRWRQRAAGCLRSDDSLGKRPVRPDGPESG